MNPAETVIATLGAFGALWLAWAIGRTRSDRELRRAWFDRDQARKAAARADKRCRQMLDKAREREAFIAAIVPSDARGGA